MKKIQYLVQFNREDEKTGKKLPPKYLRVLYESRCGVAFSLVNDKSGATAVDNLGIAHIVSDYFWESYWEKYKESTSLSSRQVVIIKRRSV
jgi:hypothetical protein